MKNLPVFNFTKEGFENLKKEERGLIQKRPQVLARMVEARDQGDLSENAGYHAAKEELAHIDSRLRELKLLLRLGKIHKGGYSETVTFGSRVTVENEKQTRKYSIVSGMEANPAKGKLSDTSPIGSALLGKKVGETVTIEVPNGKVEFKILKIE